MSFDRVRAEGGWVVGPIDPDEMEAFDAIRPHLIDALDGGSWSPNNPIVIGGAGFEFGTQAEFSGGINVSSGGVTVADNVTIGGTLDVTGTTTLGILSVTNGALISDVTITTGGLVVQAGTVDIDVNTDIDGTLNVSDNTFIGGTFEVAGESEFNSNVTVNGQVTASGNCQFTGGYTVGGSSFVLGSLSFGAGGHLRYRQVEIPDGDFDASADEADLYYRHLTFLSADRTATLDPDASNGQRIRFASLGVDIGGNSLHIRNQSGSTLYSLSGQDWCEVQFVAGGWRVIGGGSLI